MVNFDLGERFPRPSSQQRRSLRPRARARRVAVLGVGAGGGHPRNFFLRFLMPNPALGVGQFGPETKLIEGQPNEYDVICRNEIVYNTRPKTVTHPSCNRARRALTSFMRRTALTTRAFQFAIRIDSIRYANRFESIRFVKKSAF